MNDRRKEIGGPFDAKGYLHLKNGMTPNEVAETLKWAAEAESTDIEALNADNPDGIRHQLNRPVSRIIDADPRFACFLNHPAAAPYLETFLGDDYRHIDNELYYTYPGYAGGNWHRGVSSHANGHVSQGAFICPMVKVFYCLTDVGPGEGEFAVVPGSHRSGAEEQEPHAFDDVSAGDMILFNEGLLHNGLPNLSTKTRKTIIVNFGRVDAAVWAGYKPSPRTLSAAAKPQRAILTNAASGVWREPDLSNAPP